MTARAKGRTVRAWAVCCTGDEFAGEIHDLEYHRADARYAKGHYDDDGMQCSPHRVVALVGTFQPKAKAGKKGKGER